MADNASIISPLPGVQIELGESAANIVAPLPAVVVAESIGDEVSISAPGPSVVTSDIAGGVDSVLIAAPRAILLAGDGTSDTVHLVVPVAGVSISDYQDAATEVSISAPSPVLSSYDQVVLTAVFNALVVNAKTRGHSPYSNYPFTGLVRFNGIYLGCKSDGIFTLSGSDDAGTAIDAFAETGVTDFGSAQKKSIQDLTAQVRGTDDLALSVTVDGAKRRTYPLSDRGGKEGIVLKRVKGIPKGLKGNHWQFRVSNKQGGDFDIAALQATTNRLSRL